MVFPLCMFVPSTESFKLYSLNLSCTVVNAFMPFPRFLFNPLQHINCSSSSLVILIYFNQPFTILVKEIGFICQKQFQYWIQKCCDACFVFMMLSNDRQLTDSDLNNTGKAEDSPSSQRSDRSRRVRSTRRARWPWVAAHWEVNVREKWHGCYEQRWAL